jgi:rod shape-determining protein MreC
VTGVRNLAWLSGALAAATLLLVFASNPLAGEAESRMAALVAPVAGGLRSAARPAREILLNAGRLGELSRENASLRQDLAQAQAEMAALREERRADEQSSALDLAAGQLGARVTAPVLLRDPAPGRQVLLVGRGRADGVQVGQPVLGPGATLVGVVIAADEHRGRVRLLTDGDSAIAALLQSSRTQASLAGTGHALRLDLVPSAAPTTAGEIVLSSALGGLLPPGLLAGRVAHVETRTEELFARIQVEPLVDFNRLEQVLILTGFQPGTGLGGGIGGR